MSEVLVVVPTHAHGGTLPLAVGSVLAQAHSDLDVVIVCDGADDATLGSARELAELDTRVRVAAFAKGERHGEAHRDAVIRDSGAEFVFTCADDDLWFPDHVGTVLALLRDADFAHAPAVHVRPDQTVETLPTDVRDDYWRELILTGPNRIPLAAAGHRRDAYLRLESGWAPAPTDVPTDQFMWRKWLRDPTMRCVSSFEPTVVCFPSPWRREWDSEQRVAELRAWVDRIDDPTRAAGLRRELAEIGVRERLEHEGERMRLSAHFDATAEHVRTLEAIKEQAVGLALEWEARLKAAEAELERLRRNVGEEAPEFDA